MPKATQSRNKHYREILATRPIPSLSSRNYHSTVFQDTVTHRIDIEEIQRLWKMRWCFFWVCIAFCTLWMLGTIVASIVIFCVTKNFLSFSISIGVALPADFMRRFANYLLMDERMFLLKKRKIEMKAHRFSKSEQPNCWLSNKISFLGVEY